MEENPVSPNTLHFATKLQKGEYFSSFTVYSSSNNPSMMHENLHLYCTLYNVYCTYAKCPRVGISL